MSDATQAEVLGALSEKVLDPQHAHRHPQSAQVLAKVVNELPALHPSHAHMARPFVQLDNAIRDGATGWSVVQTSSAHRSLALDVGGQVNAYADLLHGGILREVATSSSAQVRAKIQASIERYSRTDFGGAHNVMEVLKGMKPNEVPKSGRTRFWEVEVGGGYKHSSGVEVSGRTKFGGSNSDLGR